MKRAVILVLLVTMWIWVKPTHDDPWQFYAIHKGIDAECLVDAYRMLAGHVYDYACTSEGSRPLTKRGINMALLDHPGEDQRDSAPKSATGDLSSGRPGREARRSSRPARATADYRSGVRGAKERDHRGGLIRGSVP